MGKEIVFNDEIFLQIDEAEGYLDEPSAVRQLDFLYVHYKGFADYYRLLSEPTGNCLDEAEYYAEAERVYLDGLGQFDSAPYWQAPYDGADFVIRFIGLYRGLMNGRFCCIDDSSYFDTGINTFLNSSCEDNPVYVKLSDLNELAEKYGINVNSRSRPSEAVNSDISIDTLFTKPPTNHSDTFEAIKKEAISYIEKNKSLPSSQQLWAFIKENDTSGCSKNTITIEDAGKTMDKDAFRSNYNRWAE